MEQHGFGQGFHDGRRRLGQAKVLGCLRLVVEKEFAHREVQPVAGQRVPVPTSRPLGPGYRPQPARARGAPIRPALARRRLTGDRQGAELPKALPVRHHGS